MPGSRLGLAVLAVALAAGAAGAQDSRADSVDAFVRAQMAARQIPGLSIAIVDQGRVVLARGYGVRDHDAGVPVTTTTLFQAGSISKPVSALGALHLVEAGRLDLDTDVNRYLTSWNLPENAFTAMEKVTLRRLLSHSAGVTVHGFPGYDVADSLPTLVQVLDGAPPANTAAIRVDTTPGARWRYSGGGFTIMQQLLTDVTGTPFPRFMREAVLGPIGMTGSSFEQPPPAAHAALTAGGYYADRTPVRGRWHVYPEMAAAGLWTTPTDLARFAIEIQETLAGKGHGVISPGMARQYVTEQKGGSGLGIAVAGTGRELRFSHGGRDDGFDALLVATAETGQGLAAMINANDNSGFMGRLQRLVARLYRWPGAPPAAPPAVRGTRLSRAALDRVAGYYEARENQMMALAPSETGEGVVTLTDGLPDETLLALDSLQFAPAERPGRMTFTADAGGQATGLTWRGTGPELRMPKVSPLPSSVTPAPDPDPGLTERIRRVIPALLSGGPALAQEVDVTPGARQDFARGARPGVTLDSLGYIGTADVTGRGLRRHGADVSRVRYYRVRTNAGPRYLLVHLTADGLVTDYDLVQR